MSVRNLQKSFLFLFLIILSGCVGTVQEAVSPDTLKLVNPPTTFVFPGITAARAISHSRVELEFFPADGTEITYKLYVNNAITPIPIDPQSLLKVSGGKILYTVDGLQADREYKFKITASNNKTAAISIKENEAYARTFDNIVTDFNGISKLSLVPGDADESILVDWISPTMSGIFTAGPYDPVNYEVTVISEIGGAPNLNNPLYAELDKRIIYVPTPPSRATPLSNPNSVIIDSLRPGTRYYVQVRAINSLYRNYQEDATVTLIPVDREVNTKFLSIKTDSSASLFDFNQDNIILANAPGIDAFDKIDAFWQPGSGSFAGYRVFVRKYDGLGDPSLDDKLTESNLNSMNLLGNYFPATASSTSRRVSGLDNGGYYQVKIALCKTISCPVSNTDPDAAIISDLKMIRVHPTLAPFSGINSTEPPAQYSEKDFVKLKFDAPLVTSGYANLMEFYCVDPADHSQMVLFDDADPITGSSISRCNGLSLDGVAPALTTYTFQKVKGLVTDGTKEYCFAASPAIIGYGADIRLPVATRIIRCTYPEISPPTVAQFSGLNNTCTVSATNGNVTWSLPTGGIYSGFKVYWKEKNDLDKFSFPHAIAGTAGYFTSADIAAASTSYTATNLMPGKTYQIGVLATVDLDAPAKDLYSEYNLKVLDCVVPLPIATFKSFTRIFAVGPKLDGRVPNDPSTKSPAASSALYEAIDTNGTPYEVAMTTATVPHVSSNFAAPPGRDFGATFGASFDGASETSFGYSMSKDGIISLSWEDVSMSFPEADTLFVTNQPASPALRTNRKWGYKVFRSADNKLTWKELTTTNGLIYSTPYTYLPRPNMTAVNTRMAFFTDYSVKSLYEVHDAANARDVERARTYYYRIVPVFDDHQLVYSINNQNIVKVTLPPPNMALVHRWMANRAHCLEFDKAPDISLNYTCSYNGINSKPKNYPYRVGNTVLDQAGDLLVDRNELGCRYTRGDRVATPEVGASSFALAPGTKRHPDDQNFYPLFRGYRTVTETEDTSTPFKGCVGVNSESLGATGTGADYASGFTADYNHMLQGDCIGGHLEKISAYACSALQFANNEYFPVTISVPGAARSGTPGDCSATNAGDPTNMVSKLQGFYGPNFVMQSEFLGVFYNTRASAMAASDKILRFEGPNVGSLSSSRALNSNWDLDLTSSQCSVNLAAIDGSGYMRPRWLSVNELSSRRINFKNSTGELLNKTVDELTEVKAATVEPLTFYNGIEGDLTAASYKLPNAGLRSSPRYRGTTRIGKVLSSNSAKLPPLGKLNAATAEALCANSWVQTGVASDNGNFSPDSQPVAKRPLRRTESISASAWPDNFTTANIATIEASTTAGSCNNLARNISGIAVNKGDLISNQSSVGTNSFSAIPLVTGSSPYNGLMTNIETMHTSRCISRYGIQDIVGNLGELNSERLFCDYSQDAIFLGPVTATWSGGTGAENKGNGGPDINFFNSNTERSDWAVVKQGRLTDGTTVQFQLKFRNGSPTRTDIKPWIKISTDSGYCSPVDGNPAKRSGTVDVFKDIATGYWSPLYLPGGALNSTIIEQPQTDQNSASTWRNGDGRFLDFGPQSIGFALNHANNLSLSTGLLFNKYFNPVIGMPLRCENGSCDDPLLSVPNDNTYVTTTAFDPNVTTQDDIPGILDFPVGNSQIAHQGLSDYQYPASGNSSALVPLNGGVSNITVYNILTSVLVDDPVTMGNPVRSSKTYPQDFEPGSTFQYYRVIWDVERDAKFAITSGGKSNMTATGRYTASIQKSEVSNTYLLNTTTQDLATGTRCAIMINQDP
jgi:hypothetical protein